MLKELMISLRPRQWYKNLVLFAGVVFSLNLLNFNTMLYVIIAFVIFVLLSGSVYIINDIIDKEVDEKHPIKSKRPVASGLLKTSHAGLFAIVLMSAAIFASFFINANFLIISLIYVILTLSYSLFLKKVYIIDITSVSMGFILRAVAGCLAISVSISPWIIICTFLLAVFLAAGKRRHEYTILGINLKSHREIFERYSAKTLERLMKITAFSLTVVYTLYAFLSGHFYMVLTVPIILPFFKRYFSLVRSSGFGTDDVNILKDRWLLASIVSWFILVVLVLYFIPGG